MTTTEYLQIRISEDPDVCRPDICRPDICRSRPDTCRSGYLQTGYLQILISADRISADPEFCSSQYLPIRITADSDICRSRYLQICKYLLIVVHLIGQTQISETTTKTWLDHIYPIFSPFYFFYMFFEKHRS